MANELKHGSVGTELTQAEWEAVGAHVFDSQAEGDIVYASSSSQLSRLGKGADNTVLHLASGVPAWSATLAGLTLTTPTISATGFANANHAHAAANSGGTLTTVGALDAGSITSNFGNIDNGSSTLDTGAATVASLDCSNGSLSNVGASGNDWTATLLTHAGSAVIGNTAKVAGLTDANVQIQGFGDDTHLKSSLLMSRHNGAAVEGPFIQFVKSRGTAADSVTVVADNDIVAHLIALPADGTDLATLAGDYRMEVDDASPATGDIGMAHVWKSMPGGGGGAAREVMRLTAAGELDLNSGDLLNVGASGNDWTTNLFVLQSANGGAGNMIKTGNTSDTSSSHAVFYAVADGTSAGDAYGRFRAGTHETTWGMDNSADKGAIGQASTLGANDVLRFTIATPPVATYNAAHPTGTFDYVCETCQEHSGTPFNCHGEDAVWHDDVAAMAPVLQWADDPGDPELLRHMANLGIFDLKQSGNEIVPWVGLAPVRAHFFTWSAMRQMYRKIEGLESELKALKAA